MLYQLSICLRCLSELCSPTAATPPPAAGQHISLLALRRSTVAAHSFIVKRTLSFRGGRRGDERCNAHTNLIFTRVLYHIASPFVKNWRRIFRETDNSRLSFCPLEGASGFFLFAQCTGGLFLHFSPCFGMYSRCEL